MPSQISSGDRLVDQVERLIGRLRALREVDTAVLDLIALGAPAIASLREFLFSREPSGLYQPRCGAVAALAGLRADDVLLDFLRAAPEIEISDPVERTGEDAVINAAARALKHRRDDRIFHALMRLAGRWRLAGVIEALGEIGREEALPGLIEGLSSDFTRAAAEAALRRMGSPARLPLIDVALRPLPSAEFETASSRRMRRSAMGLLCDIGVTSGEWLRLRPVMKAQDTRLAALTCNLALATRQPLVDQKKAVRVLVRMLATADWLLTVEIESWLIDHYEAARPVLGETKAPENSQVGRSLRRVMAAAAMAGVRR